ncbi:probable galacturonosyltransferase 7 isoform X2 [Magnolia sinica]|uniref:probable galacturonosyltransferase 7 isoform X2 n=1 Tax=Magnolia sinica TaxID=86752 RepID=UPI00265A30A5|nr:probable galacturonosyltransferase 7 isoform X2 [Magnolia sinica]
MKGSASIPLKRGWRGLVLVVVALVFLSMTVPLSFMFGPHNNRNHFATYGPGGGSIVSDSHVRVYDLPDLGDASNQLESDPSRHVDELLTRFGPTLSKDVIENLAKETDSKSSGSAEQNSSLDSGGLPIPPAGVLKSLQNVSKEKAIGTVGTKDHAKGVILDEIHKSCQLEFGSYCLWCEEHKEEMKDSMVKKLKDQLFVARAYYPSIAKLPAQDKLSREMKLNIQDFERMLSEATTDANLPPHVEKKIQKMEAVIAKAKSFPVDCNNVVKKFAQLVDLTEDEAHFHMKQSAFLYQLAVQTMPKSHHCLSMRLTVEYFRSHPDDIELSQEDKQEFPSFYHYIVFSRNILASSVVINSTVMHSEDTGKLVFHLITDGEKYVAMKHWFLRSSFKNATIHVLNVEDANLNFLDGSDTPRISFSDEFRVSLRTTTDGVSAIRMRTEYLSVFGPAYFLLPEIFQNLERVVVLSDDVVVQRDLSPLWNLDMKGKVNGAVEFCQVRLGQMRSYFGGNSFNSNSCAWMSGLNVIDLTKWRELKVTETYQRSSNRPRVRDHQELEHCP